MNSFTYGSPDFGTGEPPNDINLLLPNLTATAASSTSPSNTNVVNGGISIFPRELSVDHTLVDTSIQYDRVSLSSEASVAQLVGKLCTLDLISWGVVNRPGNKLGFQFIVPSKPKGTKRKVARDITDYTSPVPPNNEKTPEAPSQTNTNPAG